MEKIFVTKSFLPPQEEYLSYIDRIWQSNILTNQGSCLYELQNKLKEFLHVKHLQCVVNGTVALQLALSALDLEGGEVITTPFTYVATLSAILWQKCTPVFVDINEENFTIDANKIEEAITEKTKAIMAVHVFGYACDVEKIQKIAEKHNLKVIYDGAHAFAAKYKGKSLLDYGDISTLSFHSTKLFHTVEGGACIINDIATAEKIELQKRFGHNDYDHICLGINAKLSEMHAAMGLANFPYIESIIRERKRVSDIYSEILPMLQRQKKQEGLEHNYSYYPVLFSNEEELLRVVDALAKHEVYPRRYFYPSLNTLSYVEYMSCPISEDISRRILCLPLYSSLNDNDALRIAEAIKSAL